MGLGYQNSLSIKRLAQYLVIDKIIFKTVYLRNYWSSNLFYDTKIAYH